MECIRARTAVHHGINLALVALLVAATLAIRKGLLMKPPRNGFFCGDQSVRYPLKEESVRTSLIVVFGSAAVLVVSVTAEIFLPKGRGEEEEEDSPKKVRRDGSSGGLCCCASRGCRRFPPWAGGAARSFLLFLVGFCVSVLLVELGKVTTGVLRPNFVAACGPDVTCQLPSDAAEYRSDFNCTRADEEEEEDARKSFPSGHAAVVAYMASFLCLFLQRRPWSFGAGGAGRRGGAFFLLRPAVQVLSASVAWVTSLSRVSDHVHHVSDVVVGLVVGCVVAAWAEGLAWQAAQGPRRDDGPGQQQQRDVEDNDGEAATVALDGGKEAAGDKDRVARNGQPLRRH